MIVSYIIRFDAGRSMIAEKITADGAVMLASVDDSSAYSGDREALRSEMQALRETCEADCPVLVVWHAGEDSEHIFLWAGPIDLDNPTHATSEHDRIAE